MKNTPIQLISFYDMGQTYMTLDPRATVVTKNIVQTYFSALLAMPKSPPKTKTILKLEHTSY